MFSASREEVTDEDPDTAFSRKQRLRPRRRAWSRYGTSCHSTGAEDPRTTRGCDGLRLMRQHFRVKTAPTHIRHRASSGMRVGDAGPSHDQRGAISLTLTASIVIVFYLTCVWTVVSALTTRSREEKRGAENIRTRVAP